MHINKKQIISTIVSITVSTFLVASVVFAVTTISGTTVTLENNETITNATDTQISLVGAGELTATRVGLLRAGYNGYGSEIGGSGYDPVTITTSTGNRAGAEFYYGFSGTSGEMRGARLMIDSQAADGGTTAGLYGMDIAVRGNPAASTSVTITEARGLLVGLYPKGDSTTVGDTITTGIGVQSLIDLQDDEANTITTWKAYDVKIDNPENTYATLTNAYGLYFEASTAGMMTADIYKAANDHLMINTNPAYYKTIRLNSQNYDLAGADQTIIGFQSKPRANLAGGSVSVTGAELEPGFNTGVGGKNLIGLKSETTLKGTTGNLTGAVRAFEGNVGSDSGSTRTVTGPVSVLKAGNSMHGTVTNGVFVIEVGAAGGNVAWSGLANLPDDSQIARVAANSMTASPETDQEAGYIRIKIGTTTYQIPIYAE